MAKSLTPREYAISILRSAIGAMAEDLATRAISTTARHKDAKVLADAARDIATLAASCDILSTTFERNDL